jgi:hypothetical protein
MRRSGVGSGGGHGSKNVTRPSVRTGSGSKSTSPGAVGQIGQSQGSHVTNKDEATEARYSTNPRISSLFPLEMRSRSMWAKAAVALVGPSTAPALKTSTANQLRVILQRRTPTSFRSSDPTTKEGVKSWLRKLNTTATTMQAEHLRLASPQGFATLVVKKQITSFKRAQAQLARSRTFTIPAPLASTENLTLAKAT